MAGSVIRAFIPLLFQVVILHELLVNSADGLHGDEAKIVCPEIQCHLARLHVVATKEVTKNIEVGFANMLLFVSKGGVEHRSVEFAFEPREKLSVQKALDLLDTRTI